MEKSCFICLVEALAVPRGEELWESTPAHILGAALLRLCNKRLSSGLCGPEGPSGWPARIGPSLVGTTVWTSATGWPRGWILQPITGSDGALCLGLREETDVTGIPKCWVGSWSHICHQGNFLLSWRLYVGRNTQLAGVCLINTEGFKFLGCYSWSMNDFWYSLTSQ